MSVIFVKKNFKAKVTLKNHYNKEHNINGKSYFDFDFDFETKMVTLLRYLELLESWPNRSKGYPLLGSCKKHAAYLQSSLFLVLPEGNELESGRGWLFVSAWNLHSVIEFRHFWKFQKF